MPKYLVKDDRSECRGRHAAKSPAPEGWHLEDGIVDSRPHDHVTEVKEEPVFNVQGDGTVVELHAVRAKAAAEITADNDRPIGAYLANPINRRLVKAQAELAGFDGTPKQYLRSLN